MNSEKLKQMQSSVRLGGKGSVRRKRKYVAPPKLSATDRCGCGASLYPDNDDSMSSDSEDVCVRSLGRGKPCAASKKQTNVVQKPEQISPNKDATTNKQSTKKPGNTKANSTLPPVEHAVKAEQGKRSVVASAALADESFTFGDMSAQEIQKIVKQSEHTLPTYKEKAETAIRSTADTKPVQIKAEKSQSTQTNIKTKQGKGFKQNPVKEPEERATSVSEAATTTQPSSKKHNKPVQPLRLGGLSSQQVNEFIMDSLAHGKQAEQTLTTDTKPAQVETNIESKTKQGNGLEHNKQVQPPMFGGLLPEPINKFLMDQMKFCKQAEQTLTTDTKPAQVETNIESNTKQGNGLENNPTSLVGGSAAIAQKLEVNGWAQALPYSLDKIGNAIQSPTASMPTQIHCIDIELEIKPDKGFNCNPIEKPGLVGGGAASAGKTESTSKEHKKLVESLMLGDSLAHQINTIVEDQIKLAKQTDPTLTTCEVNVNVSIVPDTKPVLIEAKKSPTTQTKSNTKQDKGLKNKPIEKPEERLVGVGASSAGKAETTAQLSSKQLRKLVQSIAFADISPQLINTIVEDQTKLGNQTEPTLATCKKEVNEAYESPTDTKPININLKAKQSEGLKFNLTNETFLNYNQPKELAAAFGDEAVLTAAHSSNEQLTFLKMVRQQIHKIVEQQSKLIKQEALAAIKEEEDKSMPAMNASKAMSSMENLFIANGLSFSVEIKQKEYSLLEKVIGYHSFGQCFLGFIKEPEEPSNVAGGGAEIEQKRTGQRSKTRRAKKRNTR